MKMKISDEDDALKNNPLGFFVLSADMLMGRKYDQKLTPDWGNRPPLFQQFGAKANDEQTLKRICRKGIPEALRSAIWLTNAVRKSRPQQSLEETYEYGTLKKVEILDYGWEVVKKNIFPDESDAETATIPDFGFEHEDVKTMLIKSHCVEESEDHFGEIKTGGEKGMQALTQVLVASRQQLGIEYCPLLPDLTALFLSVMHESYTYALIREMSINSDYYFPMSKGEHVCWCKTFADIMQKMYPQTALLMKNCGALSPDGLDPVFKRFLVPVLKREHVLHILDMYTIEGYKVLFRMTGSILCLCTHYMKASDFRNVDAFWRGVKKVTHSHKFHFEVLVRQSYGFNGRRYIRRRSFPRRKFIQRLMDYNEDWARQYASSQYLKLCKRPLGFVEGKIPIVLAKNAAQRLSLMEFLPYAYKSTKIELIYSSNVHGRSLELFYRNCAKAKHTITLVEVLQTGATLGMFATETWHESRTIYGDGECVLFRLQPDPVSFPWSHQDTDLQSVGSTDEETVMSQDNDEALQGEFMLSTKKFIAMGNSQEGLSGLRLNEDLTKGSSSTARGFENEPLAGMKLPDFEVGLVEVYHLVREIDGKPVDGEEDLWKGMFD